jgi:hypothetical protein
MRLTNARWENGDWQTYDEKIDCWSSESNEHYTISHWMPIPKGPDIHSTARALGLGDVPYFADAPQVIAENAAAGNWNQAKGN